MLKSNIIFRIVGFAVVVLWLQSWNLLNDPRTSVVLSVCPTLHHKPILAYIKKQLKDSSTFL